MGIVSWTARQAKERRKRAKSRREDIREKSKERREKRSVNRIEKKGDSFIVVIAEVENIQPGQKLHKISTDETGIFKGAIDQEWLKVHSVKDNFDTIWNINDVEIV